MHPKCNIISKPNWHDLCQQSLSFKNVSDWEKPSKGTMTPYIWDQYPIQIQTDYSDPKTKKIRIMANVDPNSSLLSPYTGISIGLTISIPENTVEIENHYTSNSTEMKLSNMPADSEMTGEVKWTLYKLNRKVEIRCIGKLVWEMEYIKLFDTKQENAILSQRSMKAWSKTVVEIMFNEEDTGTLGYRTSG